MNSLSYVHLPAVSCAPWCYVGDGHPHELFVEDQGCWSPEARVVTDAADLVVTLHRPVGGDPVVLVIVETGDPDRPPVEVRLSPAAFAGFVDRAQAAVAGVETGGQ